MIGRWAAVTAQQLTAISALHAEADVAVGVCAVDQHAQLLQRQVVLCQVRELRWTPHLHANKHAGKQEGRQASKQSRTLAMWRVEGLPSAAPACAYKAADNWCNYNLTVAANTPVAASGAKPAPDAIPLMQSTAQVSRRTKNMPYPPCCPHAPQKRCWGSSGGPGSAHRSTGCCRLL